MSSPEPPPPHLLVRLLHRSLLFGLAMISAVFLVLAFGTHAVPLLQGGNDVALIGFALAAAGISGLLVALLIIKPRVPSRGSGQDEAAYWQEAYTSALVLWAALEGAGILGAVGALLTGLWAPTAVAAMALAGLVILGPGRFENG